MNNERVSVIIPTYKRCGGLTSAIESVLHQSYSNIEVVVVDDNDKDSQERQRVIEIMNHYASNESVKYIQHPNNKGESAARNTGVRMATGSVIAFLDDDDQFLEHYIELLYNKMIQSKTKMVFLGNYYKYDGQYTYVKKRKYKKELYSIDDVLNCDCLISIFFMIEKDFFVQLGLFDESLRGYEDCDMWISIASQGAISVVEEPLAICNRSAGERITADIARCSQALNTMIEKWRTSQDKVNQEKLDLFYYKQNAELEKQRENALLLGRDNINFRILLKILGGNYSKSQKVKGLLIFLFNKKGEKIYRWLQFNVFNSKITFMPTSTERL